MSYAYCTKLGFTFYNRSFIILILSKKNSFVH
jgi:hypothetical protein